MEKDATPQDGSNLIRSENLVLLRGTKTTAKVEEPDPFGGWHTYDKDARIWMKLKTGQ